MNHPLWKFLPVGLAVLLIPHVAFGQPGASSRERPTVEAMPYVGYAADVESMMGSRFGGVGTLHAGTGLTFGGRLSLQLTGSLAVEGSAGYSESGHMFGGPGYGGGHMSGYWNAPLSSVRPAVGTLNYEGSLLYAFPFSRWVPYVIGGFGAFTVWPDTGGSAWTDPAGHVGAGLKFYAQPRIAFRLDLRQYVGAFRQARAFPDGWSTDRRLGAHPQITAGVAFGF